VSYDRKETRALAAALLRMTVHWPIPRATTFEFAAEVVELGGELVAALERVNALEDALREGVQRGGTVSLAERLRPNCEAAPWVVEEVKALEAELVAAIARAERAEKLLPPDTRGEGGVGQGSWSVFAGRVVEERDAARERIAALETLAEIGETSYEDGAREHEQVATAWRNSAADEKWVQTNLDGGGKERELFDRDEVLAAMAAVRQQELEGGWEDEAP
jgi:hypothetical protein